MSWARLDDRFSFNPKVVQAGNAAVGVYVRALAHCAGHATDGFVARAIADALGTRKELESLCAVELWEKVASGEIHTVSGRVDGIGQTLSDVEVVMPGDGYFIPDFLHFNPTKQESDELRSRRRESGRVGGQRNARNALRDSTGRFVSQASDQAGAWIDDQAGAWNESKQLPGKSFVQHPSFPEPVPDSSTQTATQDRSKSEGPNSNGRTATARDVAEVHS